jgi:hypothetical protein
MGECLYFKEESFFGGCPLPILGDAGHRGPKRKLGDRSAAILEWNEERSTECSG